MSEAVKIDHEVNETNVVVKISGEIDIYNTQELKDKLYEIIDINKTDMRINCEDLEYIDSTGLGILVGALKRVKNYEKNIYIYNLKENIKKLFFITGLEKLFVIE